MTGCHATRSYFLTLLILGVLISFGASPIAAQYNNRDGRISVTLVKMPYSGSRNVPEISVVPEYLEQGGLPELLQNKQCVLRPTATVALTTEEQKDYGEWHRMGMANGHLAKIVANNQKQKSLSIGLLANCTSVIGMVAGLQKSGPTRRPLRVGLVFIDAHGDFNTPETTLSGMLGGMPVAVCAGLCLHNLRQESGLATHLPTRYIVMGGVRDTDPLEQALIDQTEIEHITVDDVRRRSANISAQMDRLSKLTDVIYVHVDMDVLDPKEVLGHPLTVPDGPTSKELAAALVDMFKYPKASAFGVASTPAGEKDPGGLSRKAAYNLIMGVIDGVRKRD